MTPNNDRARARWRRLLLAPFQSKIRNRLLLYMLLLSLLPITAVSYMAISRSAGAMEREIVDLNREQLATVSEYMSEKISQLNEMLSSIVIDDKIADRMSRLDNDDITQFYRANDYITNKLSSVYYANQSVLNGVLLYVVNIGKTYSASAYQEGIRSDRSLEEYSWTSFELEHSHLEYRNDAAKAGFTIMRPINRFEDRKRLGNAALDVKWSMMDRMLSVLFDDGSEVYLLNDVGEVLYAPSSAEGAAGLATDLASRLAGPSSYEKIGDFYVFRRPVPYTFFTVVKVMPNEKVVRSGREIIRASAGIAAVFVAASLLLSILFAYKVTNPITNLVRYMRKLDWIKSDYVADRKRKDEIGLLENSFQTMVANIKGLIEFEYEATIAKRTAEVKALQAQINPHFLQNTLQLISGMALDKDAPEIHRVVKAIGGMFRYSIRNRPDVTTLREEWRHMRNYLYIQETRFPSKVVSEVELPETFAGVPIPLLTLQPLVENAFEHGFGQQLGEWRIRLGVEREGETVVVRIEDNGAGMDATRLAEIRRSLEDNGTLFREAESLGLRNVDARIKLHFGKAFGLRIESEQGAGTRVSILLPGDGVKDERESELRGERTNARSDNEEGQP
ncbi:sensor histidine kinase [Cohnella phaseoli]|uniref:histidine kinase n=1 Tax=Cohnella phaseoli TaxID=456490 RepID=A0A3D9IPA1_9BACL|nr:sensor histidine kinase [Cohnella phaseoli]RED63458.1 two-component system sensor histidine kinase YesM [Cohnella phaseoli]